MQTVKQPPMIDSKDNLIISIVDYGLGNIFSVKNACERAGLQAIVTSSPKAILESDAVILPGVGAFGNAMDSLNKLDLISVLKEVAYSPKMLIGICLGMQLLMSESEEFGRHDGLGIIEGAVTRLEESSEAVRIGGAEKEIRAKVPQVGWNRILKTRKSAGSDMRDPWKTTPLDGLADGDFMYFVHSFYVKPNNPEVVLSVSRYGNIEFCSTIAYKNIIAFQYHPERSGPQGLHIYNNMASIINNQKVAKKGTV